MHNWRRTHYTSEVLGIAICILYQIIPLLCIFLEIFALAAPLGLRDDIHDSLCKYASVKGPVIGFRSPCLSARQSLLLFDPVSFFWDWEKTISSLLAKTLNNKKA
ncbi:hypothetical protein J3458_021866 [Metarhizium acridum]|uniref:uncharacterized protein n=1 Tax=Metarhizium acridum TaxID=92637 RepID=UPI001C6B7DB3|nr:hypothetical protein J3458_021866 [Metarhizium acridum]